jgi:hypothetical protein
MMSGPSRGAGSVHLSWSILFGSGCLRRVGAGEFQKSGLSACGIGSVPGASNSE